MAELLFWPALLAYGEAAVAYVGVLRRPELATRLAIWGVRIGWLAQTALLARRPCARTGSRGRLGGRAQPLRLARRRRVPDLGLPPALPAARARGDAAAARSSRSRGSAAPRRRRVGRSSSPCTSGSCSRLRRVRAGRRARRPLPLAGAAAEAAPVELLRLGPPSLRHARRARRARRAVALVVHGGDRARLRARARRSISPSSARSPRGSYSALALLLRRELGWRGRRAAYRRLAGFALVAFLGLPAGSRMRVTLVGVSHHRAAVELRERVALRLEEARDVAGELAARAGEAVCLSTCNRTELYVAHDDGVDAEARGHRVAARARAGARERALPAPRRGRGAPPLPRRRGPRLARARRGRDPRPGARGVRGRRHGRRARPALPPGAARGPEGARADRDRRVAPPRSRPRLRRSPSRCSATCDGRRILLVGAGKVSEQAARNLVSRGAEIAVVANRTLDRAAELAERFGSAAAPLEQLEQELARADVVVSSTGSPELVLRRADVERALRGGAAGRSS